MNHAPAPHGDLDTATSPSPAEHHDAIEAIEAIVNSYAGRQMPNLHLETFRNLGSAFPTRTIRAGATVQPLKYASRPLPEFPIPSAARSMTSTITFRATASPACW